VPVIACLGIASPAASGGVPVFDATAHTTRLEELAHLVHQVTTLGRQLDAITGAEGYGGWNAGSLGHALPLTPVDLARLLVGGRSGSEADEARDRLRSEFRLEIDEVDESVGSGAWLHNLTVRNFQGREAVARIAFAAAARDIAAVGAMARGIDAAHSLKSAMDLQTRTLAQTARSVLHVAQVAAAAEVAAAQARRLEAERALRHREMVAPLFVNPRLVGP